MLSRFYGFTEAEQLTGKYQPVCIVFKVRGGLLASPCMLQELFTELSSFLCVTGV